MENDTTLYGLRVANPEEDQFETVFQNGNHFYERKEIEKKNKPTSKQRQEDVVSIINKLSNENQVDSLGIYSVLRTPNAFGVRAQQALDPFINLKTGDNLTFFDIEAIGTPEHLRSNSSEKFFAMTELSFKGTKFNGKDFAQDAGATISIAVKPTKEVENQLKDMINQLSNNKGMALSEDMKRSLLDLTKYSDVNNFVKNRYRHGNKFTEILGHAKVLPSNAAITDRTIAQMRAGLNNLMEMGTTVDAAMQIFKDEVVRNNSKIAGFNIHHYDVPSLISSTSNQTLRKFFKNASSSSLDFYHAFSATTENPYSLIGGSARQENIHKRLLEKKVIRSSKGEGSTYLYHLAKDDILANIEIGGFLNQQVQQYLNTRANTSSYLFSPTNMDRTPLKVGDTIFSFQSGFFDEKRDKYSLVGRQSDKGKVEPRWNELDTSLPSMESFKIENFFENVSLSNDKTGVGVRLKSTEENSDKVLYLFGESKEDLANQIHSRFIKETNENKKILSGMKNYKKTHESPANRYKKIVEEGGFEKLSFYLDVVDKFSSNGLTDELINEVTSHKYGSAELLADIPALSARLTGERELWQEALSRIGRAGLNKEQRDVALRHFKQRVDELGDNKGNVTVPGGKYISFKFNENDTTVFNARNTDSIKSAFRNYIRTGRAQERAGDAEVSYKISHINELQKVIQHTFNIEGPEANKVKQLTDNLRKEVKAGGKIETALTELSNYVRNKVELKGSDTFERELMNGITDKRKSAIDQVLSNISNEVQSSINHAKSLHIKKRGEESLILRNEKLLGFLTEQDQRITSLFERNFGAAGMNSSTHISKAKEMAAKYEELVSGIINSYSDAFDTSLQIENGNKLYLTLHEKGKGLQNFDAHTKEELRTKTNAAIIELPSFDEQLTVSYGGQRKAAMMKSGYNKKGVLYHSTTVTDALNMLLHYSERAKELAQKAEAGYLNTIQSEMQGRVRRQVDPITSQHNRKISTDEAKIFSPKSEVAMRTASSKWDLSGFAEEWYRSEWLASGKTGPSIKAVREHMEKGYTTFFESLGAMNRSAANQFLLESVNFARERTHLQGTMAGVSNVDYGRAIMGTAAADPRRYNAFGNYYADSGENPLKTKNYRPLEEERVIKRFGDKTYRYQNSLISSDMAGLREEASFIRGIQTQSGYMTDHEIANRLKNADRIAKYKQEIDEAVANKVVTEDQARAMKAALDSHMLSSSEGLGFMDHTLFEAYDVNTEKRISFNGDSVEFDKKIEQKIEEALIAEGREDLAKNQAWKQTTFSFDKPIEINIDDLIGESGKTTVGMYTRGTIIESLEKEKDFRRGDKVTINGFSGDSLQKTLVLGREDKMGHGLKIVTEGGYRGTMVPMLKSIIEDIYDQKGIDQVITHLSSKKGANDLAAIIRGYETNIRQQLNGEATEVSGWVKQRINQNKSENDILEEYYEQVRSTFKIDKKDLYMKDGISVVSSDLGFDGEKNFDLKQRKAFIEQMNENLGLKRVIYGDVNFAHDVPLYQGGLNRGKYTLKEIEMLDKAYERAFGEPGQQSELTKYLRSMISGDLATSETRVKQKAYREMLQAAESYNDGWTPSKNDIVIDYTTDGPAVQGEINAVKQDGVIHVSKDHFKAVPTAAGRDVVFTVQDYMKTIVKAGDESIRLEDGYESVIAKHLADNKASAYLKLPEEVGAKNQFVPLIDVSSMSLPIRPEEKQMFLNATQAHYARIDRLINEYNGIHVNEKTTDVQANDDKRKALDRLINETEELKKTFAKYTSGDGMADITSRRMPMSSHFQFAGVNSVSAYSYENGKWIVKDGLDEGTLYMNRKNVSDLIGDKAENIVKTWNVNFDDVMAEVKAKQVDDASYDLKKWALDNWNEYDTYSTAVRYPSIDSATNQALKLKIHDGVGVNQVMGLRGLAERLSGDWDGDNLAVFLTHYGIKDDGLRKRVVNDVSRLQEYDAKRNKFFADLALDQMKSEMEDDLIKEVLGESKKIDDLPKAEQVKLRERAQKVTDLHFSATGEVKTIGDKAMEDAFNAVIQSNGTYGDWGKNKVGEGLVARQEYANTLAARATFQSVGSADKVRMRMSAAFKSVALQRYNHFGDAEGIYQYSKERYRRETAMVDEFLREFSQKAISSKKTELGDLAKGSASEVKAVAESLEELYGMIAQLSEPNAELNIGDITKTLIEDKGLFKSGKIPLENKFGVLYKNADGKDDVYKFVEDNIRMLQEAEQFHVEVTGKRIKDVSATMLAASQGFFSFEELSRTVRTGEHLPGQVSAEEQRKYLSKSALKRYNEYEEIFSEGVRRSHRRIVDNQHGNRSDRLADNASVSDIMNSGTRANSEIIANGDVAVYRTIRSQIDDAVSNVASKTQRVMSASAIGMMTMGAAGFAGLWAGNTLMGKTPTPEGVAQAAAPVNPDVMQTPSARITPNQNGEYINIQVKASNAKNLNPNDIAAMLNTELMAQSGVTMNHNVMVSDNSRNIDQQWLQGAVYNAMNKGYAY